MKCLTNLLSYLPTVAQSLDSASPFRRGWLADRVLIAEHSDLVDRFLQRDVDRPLRGAHRQLEQLAHADAMKTDDYPSSWNRDFHFRFVLPDNDGTIRVTICAYVRSDSATCRRVVKGTRMEEVTQYELVCE